MSTKLFWLTLFAVLAVSIHAAKTSDDYDDDLTMFNDPELDPTLLEIFGQGNRMIEDDDDDANDANTAAQTSDQTAKETKTVSTSNNDVPENEKIHQEGVLYDGDYHNFLMKACEFVEVILKKKDLEIRANGILNTGAILVTSVPFDTCDEISEFDCPSEGFCKIQNLQDERDNEGIKLGNEVCQNEVLYLYPIPADRSLELEFEVRIITGDEIQCEATPTPSSNTPIPDASTNNTDSTSTEKSEDDLAKAEAACAAHTTVDACQPSLNECSSQCMWVTCGVKSADGNTTNTSASCIPRVTSENIQARCETNKEFAAAPKEDQVIDYPICEVAERAEIADTPSIVYHPASKVVGIVVLVSVTLFLVIVCFYRCQFRKYGEGPFSPPSCCPGFIFPRQKLSGFQPITVDRRHEMIEYQPPVL